MKRAIILFFTAGMAPTADEYKEAGEYGLGNIRFRNAQAVKDSDPLERADGVAGEVPQGYEGYPTAAEGIKAVEAENKADVKATATGTEAEASDLEAARAQAHLDTPAGAVTGEQRPMAARPGWAAAAPAASVGNTATSRRNTVTATGKPALDGTVGAAAAANAETK